MAQGGEDEVARFDSFFRLTAKRLYGQAYVLTGSREVAEDLTQEALLRAWNHWRRIGDFEDPESWTRRVLQNLCIDSWRKRDVRMSAPSSRVPITPEIPLHHLQLAEAMRALPGNQARALLMHDGLGMSVCEIADELQVPEGTITSWLSRSRKIVAARLNYSDVEWNRR